MWGHEYFLLYTYIRRVECTRLFGYELSGRIISGGWRSVKEKSKFMTDFGNTANKCAAKVIWPLFENLPTKGNIPKG
jgi:hypothetical protein